MLTLLSNVDLSNPVHIYWLTTAGICLLFCVNMYLKARRVLSLRGRQEKVRAAFARMREEEGEGGTEVSWSRRMFRMREQVEGGPMQGYALMIGIDFSASADFAGLKFGDKLHSFSEDPNPFEQMVRALFDISLLSSSLTALHAINAGEARADSIFRRLKREVEDTEKALCCYRDFAPVAQRGATSSLKPFLKEAMQVAKISHKFVVAVALLAGDLDKVGESIETLVEASRYPIALVCVGIGDGPYTSMEKFSSALQRCHFDNFQFFHLGKLLLRQGLGSAALDSVENIFQTLPSQYVWSFQFA